jgi:serine/threonine protein phosphatase PrpC
MDIPKKHYNFEYGNASDIGKKRRVNEDYYANFDTKNGYVFLVCDGMGGHKGGEKASRIAVQAIKKYLLENIHNNMQELLKNAFSYANREILDYALFHTEFKGMGSTCVALLINKKNYYYAHVGDSRLYYSGSEFKKLTKDHSFVQTLVDMGEISEHEAENHPRKNEINNVLGIEYMKPATVCEFPVIPKKGDSFLLCTDGLYGMVSDVIIRKILMSENTLTEKANELIRLANIAGGYDNITLQIVKVGNSELSICENIKTTMSRVDNKILLLLLLLSYVGFGAYYLYYSSFTSQNNKKIIAKNYQIDKKQKKISEICFVIACEDKVILKNVEIENKKLYENSKDTSFICGNTKIILCEDVHNYSRTIEIRFNDKNIVLTYTVDGNKMFSINNVAIDKKFIDKGEIIELNKGIISYIDEYSIKVNKYKAINNTENVEIIVKVKN